MRKGGGIPLLIFGQASRRLGKEKTWKKKEEEEEEEEEEEVEEEEVPDRQQWHAKWKLSRNTYTLRTHFRARLGADLHAQSVIINKKILRRSSGKSLSRVRCWLGGGGGGWGDLGEEKEGKVPLPPTFHLLLPLSSLLFQ